MIPAEPVFRILPTDHSRQKTAEDRSVCRDCLSGACCTSEDPIYVTAFDILRLSAFFDLSPAAFMLRFTQDRFEGEDSDLKRRPWIDDPATSVVTYLRRRANYPTSPCIFLKYIRQPDGTPRRVCSVHDARPLSCREYYYDTCKTRWTGEIASIVARAFILVRDGMVSREATEAALGRLNDVDPARDPIGRQLELAFWTEVRRALDVDEANNESAVTFDLAAYQDPVGAKVDRMLSSAHLRLEEKYGPIPHGEQLHRYNSGVSFPSTEDYSRIMRITQAPGPATLFASGDFRHYVACRFLVPGAAEPRRFPLLSAAAANRLAKRFPAGRERQIAEAALRASNAIVRLASFAAGAKRLLELEPDGAFERDLLFVLSRLESSMHPCWHLHPGLVKARDWARSKAKLPPAWKKKLKVVPPASPSRAERWLRSQSPDGTWNADPHPAALGTQGDYWRTVLHSTAVGLLVLRPRLKA